MLNSVSGFEEDLIRLKGWTLCTPLVKPVRGGWWATRTRGRSSGRAEAVGAARPDVRCGAMRTFCCWIGDHSILPQLLYAIPIASRVSRFVESESTTQQYKPARLLSYSLTSSFFWYSCLGDHSLLPQLLSAIPIASTAHTDLARAGLRNLCSLKVLHGSKQDLNVLGARGISTSCPTLRVFSVFTCENMWEDKKFLRS